MKKQWNAVLWVVVAAFVLVAAYTVYNKYGKDFQLKQTPPQTEETGKAGTGGNTGEGSGNNGQETTNKIMVPDFELKNINGDKVKLSDYRGKVVVLNFWAVWCKYCREEMPDLEKVHKKFSEEGSAVILAINSQEDNKTVSSYLSENKLTLPVLMDYDGAITGMFGIEGFPTTFIVNSDGTLYTVIPGATNAETILKLAKEAK